MMISEGGAKINCEEGVFYNPKMEISRDIVSATIGVVGAKTFCDGHSATGIKAIRARLENENLECVDAVDLSKKACALIQKNILLNGLEGKINAIQDDVRYVLMKKNYDFVEIDPFGTPAPYFASLADSFSWRKFGHFSVTATDTAVLCGAEARACRRMYGAVPFHNEIVHENGLRILIARMQSIFAEKNVAIHPILSLSHRHYLKIFFRAEKGAVPCDKNIAKIRYFAYCEKCKNRKYIRPGDGSVCELCGSKMTVAGPVWSGLLHNSLFLKMMAAEIENRHYKCKDEELRLLQTLENENFDGFCYELHTLCRGRHIPKTADILEKLHQNGLRAAPTAYKSWIIRTNANVNEILGD